MYNLQEIFSIILFNRCIKCDELFETYCDKCIEAALNIDTTCFVCENSTDNFSTHKLCLNNKRNLYPVQSIYLTEYNSDLRKIIYGYKKYGASRYIIHKLLYAAFKDIKFQYRPDIIILVDSHKNILSRNIEPSLQSLLLQQLVKKFGYIQSVKPFAIDNFIRAQKGLGLNDRYQNIKNKISLKDDFDIKLLNDKNILVIDDILTSGATLSWIIKLLSKSNYKTLSSLHFARELIV